METIEIIKEIRAAKGTNAKIDVLKKYKDNEELKEVLYLTYSKRIKFYIKQIPVYYNKDLGQLAYRLDCALEDLSRIYNREVTGHDAIAELKHILEITQPEDAQMITMIIDRDLKLGIDSKSINKGIPKLIEIEPYMGAIAYDERELEDMFRNNEYVISDVKEDGRYANAVIIDGRVELTSRQGEITHLPGSALLDELSQLEDCVLTGELIIPGISRYKSNGIISSLVSIGKKQAEGKDVSKELSKFRKEKMMDPEDAKQMIVFSAWDRLNTDEFYNKYSAINLRTRRTVLMTAIQDMQSVRMVRYKTVKTVQEAKEHFYELIAAGEEGSIVKDPTSAWQDGKRKNQIKMKLEMTVDLKVIAFNYGTKGTKNENVISAIQCVSSDGLVKSVPAGISEADMQYITDNQEELLGSIVEVKSCGLTERDGQFALLHPVFIKFRDDKDTYDSLESIKAIENGIKGL